MAEDGNFIIVHIVWQFVKTGECVDTCTFEEEVNKLQNVINKQPTR